MNKDVKSIHYKRARFSTYLTDDRFYTPSHFWIKEIDSGIWQVGFTKFATRMLGEIVECNINLEPQAQVQVGEVIGFVEAFKAVSDIYSVVKGTFIEMNPSLLEDYSIVSASPYDRGWLYQINGTPDNRCMPVEDYIQLLNDTIDRMSEQYEGEPQ